MRAFRLLCYLVFGAHAVGGGPFDPPAEQPGSLAVPHDDPRIVAWGTAVGALDRGRQDVSDPELGDVTYGTPEAALGPADAQIDSYPVVSLGDGGMIEILFGQPIRNGPGPDFAVFENGILDTFLELAFVEVSDDGARFVRFPPVSHTSQTAQVQSFGAVDATNIHNLAGKYRRGFGTPFDLAELGTLAPALDLERITHVRIVDVIGSIDPRFASYDSSTPPRIVNDPWPTAFETGGFDLDAIGVLHQIPEPATGWLLGLATLLGALRQNRRHSGRSTGQTGRGLRQGRHGFTLIEIVVVLAITLLLGTLLFASLNRARETSDQIHCTAHLRELALANINHATENDGRYVAAQEPTNTVRWHGVRASVVSRFDPTRGPLAPYLGKEKRVKFWPTLRDVLDHALSFEEGTGGYGYNAVYIGGTPADRYTAARISHVPRAARTVMFTDTAFPRATGLQEYAYCEPWEWVDALGRPRGPLSPSVHFRHGGRANVAWCDGHVTAEAPAAYGTINQYGGDARTWKVGWFGPSTENGYWKP